jgi:hypothetical protein
VVRVSLAHPEDLSKILPEHVSAIRPFRFRGAEFYVAICKCGWLHTREGYDGWLHTREGYEDALALSRVHAEAGNS